MTKMSIETWVAIQKKQLEKFAEKWQKDMATRSPDEAPRDAYMAIMELWKDRYQEWKS